MSSDINEKISAFIDDELEQSEFETVRKRFEQDKTVQLTLNRYALISESIKGNDCSHNAQSVAELVSQQLKDEPTVLAPTKPKTRNQKESWKTYFAGAAVAATVAAVAVFNVGSFSASDAQVEQFPVTVSVSPSSNVRPVMIDNMALPASTKWTTQNASSSVHSDEIEKELNQFLMEHSEYTTQSGIPGMLPYATIVVYDKQK